MHDGASPEWLLLLALLQGRSEAPPVGMDAARLIALIDFHRVSLRLEASACANLPVGLRQALSARRRDAAAKALALTGELSRLARLFEEQGLPWLAFKGPAFGLLLHGRPDRRACRDLDLLTPVDAAGAAATLLVEAGYVEARRTPGSRQTVFRHARTGLPVELHVGMIDDDALFPERLFEPFRRVVRLDVGGVAAPTLGLEPALVFAAFHGCKHFWRRLFWVQDFADAVRSDQVDWDAAAALARTLGCERQLALAVALAERRLAAPPPPSFVARPRLLRAGRDACRILDPLPGLPTPVLDLHAYRRLGPRRTLWWRLGLHQRTAARLALILGVIRPVQADRALIALPGPLSALYYLVRPLRLLGRELNRLTRAGKPSPALRGAAPGAPPSSLTLDFVMLCGRPESAAPTLRALLACDGEGDIIVVGARLKELRAAFAHDRIVWLETDRLLWPAANRNRGAAHSRADIVAFIDDDCSVAPDFIRKVRARFAEDPDLGALTGRTRTEPPGYWAWIYDLLSNPTGQTEELSTGTGDFSCVFCMRRTTFLGLGGCNESLRFNEDVDLARRALSDGVTTLCDPAVAISHRHPRTDAKQVLAHMFRVGRRVLAYERKQAAEGALAARIKLALRPLQPLVAPAFIALKLVRLAREAPLRLWLPFLPGVLAAAVAFEAGRTVGWWRERIIPPRR